MTAFWPWIGKQEIKCFHRPGRQQITHRIRIFHAQQTHIANHRGFARGTADSTKQPLDSEKISFRQAFCQRAKKRAVTAAKIDVQRRDPLKDVLEIEPIDQRPWFDDRRTPKPFGAVSYFNLARKHARKKLRSCLLNKLKKAERTVSSFV